MEETNKLLNKINENLEYIISQNKETQESLSTIITGIFQIDFDPTINIEDTDLLREVQHLKRIINDMKLELNRLNTKETKKLD